MLDLKTFHKELKQQGGFSLVALLVALGIIGILATTFAQMFQNQMKTTSKIEDKGELEDLRNFIRIGVDCEQTKLSWPNNCPSGTNIELKRGASAATALVEKKTGKNRTRVGPYYLQAQCNGVAKQYVIYYSKTDNTLGNELFTVPKACP